MRTFTAAAGARANRGVEATHIYVEQPRFEFTELFMSDSELEQLCVIPTREAPAPIARWMPAQRPVPHGRRSSTRPLQAMMAAGMAWLTLPGCSYSPEQAAPRLEVHIGTVRVSHPPRATLSLEGSGREVAHEQLRPTEPAVTHHARAPHAAPRAATVLTELSMLDQAKTAMDGGHYRSALTIYKHLLYRSPTQVDALFGAALASHELRDSTGADVYLKRALTLAPNHPLANILAGFTDQLGHRFVAAREHYGRYLSVEAQGERAGEIRAVLASLPTPGGSPVTSGR